MESIRWIITLCAEEVCPVFLGDAARLHWPLQDPDRKHEDLTDEERLQHFRVARDQIRTRLRILAALRDVPQGPEPVEFHASLRVTDLAAAARFYGRLEPTPEARAYIDGAEPERAITQREHLRKAAILVPLIFIGFVTGPMFGVEPGIIALAVLLYVMLDGFDLGIGILYPFIPDRHHRDVAMNTVAPVWDGNETWLVLGGAVGNIVDRVRLGYVIDYADLHFGTFRPFLIFNIADAAITIGVLIILARSFFMRDKSAEEDDMQLAAKES